MNRITLQIDMPLSQRELRARDLPPYVCRRLVQVGEGATLADLAVLALAVTRGESSCLALSHYLDEMAEREEAEGLGVPFTRLDEDNGITGRYAFACRSPEHVVAVLGGLRSEAVVMLPTVVATSLAALAQKLKTVRPRRPFEAALIAAAGPEVPVCLFESTHDSLDVLGSQEVIAGAAITCLERLASA